MDTEKRRFYSRTVIFLITCLLLLTGIYYLADHLASSNTRTPHTLYLIVAVALFFLHAFIFCFMIIQYLCDRRLLYLATLGIAFLGSVIYCVEAIWIIQNLLEKCISLASRLNDFAIFYLFRQLNFIIMFSASLYAYNLQISGIYNKKKEPLFISLFFILAVTMGILAHVFSSYTPVLNLNLTGKTVASSGSSWNYFYCYLLMTLWVVLMITITYYTRLKDLLWIAISSLCLSHIISLMLTLNLDSSNLLTWYLSRGIEVISTFFVIIVLLYDIFKMHKESTETSIRDPLTKIYNRKYFYEELSIALSRSVYNQPVSVIICDIDHFKRINDRYGHPEGDRVIKAMVDMIQRSIRSKDVFARLGGEEFSIFMPNTDTDKAQIIAERIRTTVERESDPATPYDLPEKMTLSLGIFTATKTHFTPDECINFADNALYQAKNQGRNRVVTWQL